MKDKVYYDESCYVCSLEIGMVKKRGEACGIEFVDINDSSANLTDRDYNTEMIGEFGGSETVGVETFRKMYSKMGFKKTVTVSRFPVMKQFIDLGYYIFAYWVRPRLPKRKTNGKA